MALTLLLDEDLSYRVAVGLRDRGIDAVSVHELGLASRGIPDEQHLTLAAAQGRVLVTYNRDDFQVLDEEWRSTGRVHAGILWCNERTLPRHLIGEAIRVLESTARHYDSLEGLCLPLTRLRK